MTVNLQGPTKGSDALELKTTLAGQSHRVELDDLEVGEWQVSCSGEQIWCDQTTVKLEETADTYSIQVPVYPAAVLSGRLTAAGGAEPPPILAVQAWCKTTDGTKIEHREQTAVDQGIFQVKVPQGLVDLRLSAPGWVPVYIWGVEAQTPAVALGSWQLISGGSVSGFVISRETGLPVTNARVMLASLAEEATAASISDRDRRDRMMRESTTGAKGFWVLNSFWGS